MCNELGPTAVGHRQAEQLVVIYCLFLHPVGTFSITNPGPCENRKVRERQHCYVLLILFSFESNNSFQFTYS